MTGMRAFTRRFRFIAPGGQLSEGIIGLILACAIVFGGLAGSSPTIGRMGVGIAGGLVLFLIASTGRLTALRLTLVFLVFLGFIRRLLIPFAGWSEQDPLLLVGPAAAGMIWLSGRRDVPLRKDPITFFSVLFLVWSIAQMLSPYSQGILIDAKGLLFWVPPLMWVFVGRTFPIETHLKIVDLILLTAVAVCLHGLYHSFIGFFPFEYTWVGVSQIGPALFFEDFQVKPFASLTSPQEYGAFLAVTLSFLYGTILGRRPHRALRILFFVPLVVALFLMGTRHIFVLFLAMMLITSMVWARNFGVRLAVGALAIAVIGALQLEVLPREYGDGPIATAVEHQINGLYDPSASTAPLHRQLILNGIELAIENPLGLGLSVSNLAALKGGKLQAGTEWDFSNVFVSFGLPLGILYLVFILSLFVIASKRFAFHRSSYTIGCIGVLIVNLGHLWSGGLYTVSAITFLMIGGLTRPQEELTVDPLPSSAMDRAGYASRPVLEPEPA